MNLHSNHCHLGDLQWALIFLSRMLGQHTLRCKPEYVDALRELVAGLPITIDDCSNVPPDSMDCWIASGLFERQGVQYRDDIDILGFVARYFNAMAVETNQPAPFLRREDLLCDFPSIRAWSIMVEELGNPFTGILVINCDPKSGQCPRYSSSEMDALIVKLENAGHSVCAVEKAGLSLVQIGALSIHAKLIIGCAAGPWHVCQNVCNKDTQRIAMISPMRLDYGTPLVHAADATQVETILQGMGYL